MCITKAFELLIRKTNILYIVVYNQHVNVTVCCFESSTYAERNSKMIKMNCRAFRWSKKGIWPGESKEMRRHLYLFLYLCWHFLSSSSSQTTLFFFLESCFRLIASRCSSSALYSFQFASSVACCLLENTSKKKTVNKNHAGSIFTPKKVDW